jgi:S-adenosylmethionine decarboxylase
MNHKGTHVFIDVINFYDNDLLQCCKFIFDLMKRGIGLTNMKIMHKRMVMLDKDTEEGFTSVLLLDESHITAHSYTKKGLLAIDIFTCGKSNPNKIGRFILKELKKKYPQIECVNYQIHNRFLH